MRVFPHGIRRAFLLACGGSLSQCLPLFEVFNDDEGNSDPSTPLHQGDNQEAENNLQDPLPESNESKVKLHGGNIDPHNPQPASTKRWGDSEYNPELILEEGVLLPTAHANPMLLITQFQGLQFQPIQVFDPGGILHLREPHSGVEMGILPPPQVTKQHDILLYLLMVGDFDPGGYQLLHLTYLSYALLTPGAAILHGFYTSIWLRGSSCNMRNVASLHNIYIDDKNANCSLPASPRLQAAADAGCYFLIPLRGRRCDQWNDEVEHEDVAASKMKTKRTRKLMRLFYLTKDVLDPG